MPRKHRTPYFAKSATGRYWKLEEKRKALAMAAEEMLNNPNATKNEICEKYGVSWSGLWKYMKQHGMETPMNRGSRKYTVQEDYFAVIDTEEKAYWLGFIFGDGGITRVYNSDPEPNVFKMRVHPKDRDHLVRFLKCIGSTHPIKDGTSKKSGYANQYGKEYRYSEVIIGVVEFVRHLRAAGVVERKQFTPHHFPFHVVPEHLQRHFIRGLFDADGSMSFNGKKGLFQITGDKTLLTDIQHILVKSLGLNYTKLVAYDHSNAVALVYGGSVNGQLRKIAKYLYDGATIYLPRKRDVFAPFLSEQDGPYLQAGD